MKYAYFNPIDGKVLQWLDTDAQNYNLPNATLLHACTEEEFALNDGNSEMMVKAGKVLPYVGLPPALPSVEVLKTAALAEVRALRASLFPTLSGLQSEALARGNTVDAVAIAAVQLGCRNITQTNLAGCTTKPQIDAAFLAAWMAIVAAAPISVRLAFAELKK